MTMHGVDVERWREAGALFHSLVGLDPRSRDERLTRLGTSDPTLRAAVEALLAGDAIADSALPAPGFGLGGIAAVVAGPRAHLVDLEGETIGHFRVIEHVASGGMGVVYRAEDLQLGRTVALKFPLFDRELSEATRLRMLREARAAGALDHPNLCPIYEVGQSVAGPFFAMPLYRGETLKDRLARTGTVPLDEALGIAAQLAAGLGCAHGAGIVHRDIKPGNVMLVPDGTVKLLDFGLARSPDTVSAEVDRVVGTIHYMAPERFRNEPVDARADLWALGLILYEMLAGVRPFVGETGAAIVHAILHVEPRPLRATNPAIPSAVDSLVRALLDKRRDARPQTAADVARAIDAATGGGEVALAPRRWMRRRGVVAVGAVVAVGTLLGTAQLRRPATLIATGRLSPRDTLVLADVAVPGADSTLGPALGSFVRQDFAETRAVVLMPASDVAAALERMQHPRGAVLTSETAREVARREGARAVVAGKVSPLGSGYLVTLRLIEAETGNELATISSTAATLEHDLIPALSRADLALRERIGESLRDARQVPRPTLKLTTTSLAAYRLMWRARSLPAIEEKIAAERAALALDGSFAYAWLSLGNQLDWLHYRSAARDSALTNAYRLRERLTLFERAQVTGLYRSIVRHDRDGAIDELLAAAAQDTTLPGAVPLNALSLLVEARQFSRAEALARRIARWPNVHGAALPYLVQAQRAQGHDADVASTLAELVDKRGSRFADAAASDELDRLRFDAAERLLSGVASRNAAADLGVLDRRISMLRVRGRLAEASLLEERRDSIRVSIAAVARAHIDPTGGRALAAARTQLWLRHDAAATLRALDAVWAVPTPPRDPQDRVDATDAAALYAAAGRPAKARALLDALDRGADTLVRRTTYEHRMTALAEIALAEGRFAAALEAFRASDLAADGLPATPCAVCILPHLARTAERAGWADSAQAFWEGYVGRPAIMRLTTDQWFLAMAYRRLGALATARHDADSAAVYRRRLAELLRNADARLRP